MNKGSNNWIWWTIGGLTAVGLGFGIYIFIKDRKDRKKLGESTLPDESSASLPSPSIASSSSQPQQSSVPFKNKAEGDAFRNWVNDKYPDYAKSIKLDRSGSFNNSFIAKAYSKYGQEYANRASSSTSGSSSSSSQNVLSSSTDSVLNTIKQIVSGGYVKDVEIDKKNNRVRGFALDGVGFGSNNIYVNIYSDGYIYYEDGKDSNKKGGSWTGTGPMTIKIEGKEKTGDPKYIITDLAKILYPDVKGGFSFSTNDFDDFLYQGTSHYLDINDANL